jgi:hypothetical protein
MASSIDSDFKLNLKKIKFSQVIYFMCIIMDNFQY